MKSTFLNSYSTLSFLLFLFYVHPLSFVCTAVTFVIYPLTPTTAPAAAHRQHCWPRARCVDHSIDSANSPFQTLFILYSPVPLLPFTTDYGVVFSFHLLSPFTTVFSIRHSPPPVWIIKHVDFRLTDGNRHTTLQPLPEARDCFITSLQCYTF